MAVSSDMPVVIGGVERLKRLLPVISRQLA